jgi:hypothetical protein
MTTRATGTFEIDSWDEEHYDEREGTRLARVRVAKTFRGDVEGVSTTDFLLAYGAEEGSAAYVGFERVEGRVHGRPGSFVLHHTAAPLLPRRAVGDVERRAGHRDRRRSTGPARRGRDLRRSRRRTLFLVGLRPALTTHADRHARA